MMKKMILCALSVLLLISPLALPASAAGQSYSWYCKHVKEHIQPTADASFSFVESLDGFYIDKKHADPNAADKVVYLTFDAGYENGNIEKILDVMHKEGVTGAFFVLSHLVEKNPDLIRRMATEGHLVCNHTAHHKDMSGLDEQTFMKELHDLESIYTATVGGEMAHYYRPPEGKFSKENLEVAQKNGYKTIFWSFAYPDWDNNRQMSIEKAKSIILDNVHNGEVMLLHPTSATNAAILGDVICALKSQGYRFGTLDELTAK
jgi:peptidoglycan-N-acetylmuramic acid deacetylase